MNAIYTLNTAKNGVEIRFDSKPAADVLDAIKAAGYRWSRAQRLWWARQNEKTLAVAKQIASEGVPQENGARLSWSQLGIIPPNKAGGLCLTKPFDFLEGIKMAKCILWTDEEIAFIMEHGETTPATAHAAMTRSKLNFDDIEDINGHHESHRWGSNADRAYRSRAINRAVQYVATHPLEFVEQTGREVQGQ